MCHLGNSDCPQLSLPITSIINEYSLSDSTFHNPIFHRYICQTSHFVFTLPLPLSLPVSPFNPVIISCFGNKVANHFLWLLLHISANRYYTMLMLHYKRERICPTCTLFNRYITQPDLLANEPVYLAAPGAYYVLLFQTSSTSGKCQCWKVWWWPISWNVWLFNKGDKAFTLLFNPQGIMEHIKINPFLYSTTPLLCTYIIRKCQEQYGVLTTSLISDSWVEIFIFILKFDLNVCIKEIQWWCWSSSWEDRYLENDSGKSTL